MPIVKRIRRFHSNIVSSRQVATEISNLVSGSNVEQSGSASAARLTSNKPIRKRVNNAERRGMLELYVNRYRAMNMGKFPSPTAAQKEVGGSYYSIKKMLQEMEYNFKLSPVEKSPTKENTNQINGDDTISQEITWESSESQEKSKCQITIDIKENTNQINGDDTPSREITREASESQEKSNGQIAINTKENTNQVNGDDTLSQEITWESSESQEKSKGQPTIDRNPCEDPWLESGSNSDKNTDIGNSNVTRDDTHKLARDVDLSFKDTETKVEKPSDEILNITRDKGEDNEPREKASLWGNLKSLANEFINMWKK